MKNILTLIACIVFTICTAQTSDTCPDGFEVSDFAQYAVVLEQYRDNLRDVRQWARKNNREDIVLSTLRLEYWCKDTRRYIQKNKEAYTDLVCKRLFVTDMDKFHDYLNLALFYRYMPNLAPVDHSKYK